MKTVAKASLKPRKTPVQARSTFTVNSVLEATIQVLLKEGAGRLTTTRVAERAGVSVGTLYQYYPNKQSLLFALFEHHLGAVSNELKRACRESHNRALDAMVGAVSNAFINAKLERADISTALYKIASGLEVSPIIARIASSGRAEIAAMLKTLPNVRAEQIEPAVFVIYGTMTGLMRAVLEAGAPADKVRDLREHLPILVQSYLKSVLF
jgi:AcrR family transcriptional regulator